MVKLCLWLATIAVILLSGIATIAFIVAAYREKDYAMQEFCIGAASACGFLFFLCSIIGGLLCM